MVVPPVLAFRQVRSVGIEVVAGLGQDRDALFGEFSQPVHGALQEVGVVHHFVVVQEHHRVEAERVRDQQPQVANGSVPGQAHFLCQLAQTQLLHALLDEGQLRRAHHHDVESGELGHRGLHFFRRLVLDGGLAGNQHDYLADAAHLLQRVEAPAELSRLRYGRHVVIRGENAAAVLAAASRDERGNDDYRVHARPFARFRVRPNRPIVARPPPVRPGLHRICANPLRHV